MEVVDTETAKEFMKETLAAVEVEELTLICAEIEAKSAWFRETLAVDAIPKLEPEQFDQVLGRIFSIRGKGRKLLAELDIVVASPHASLKQSPEDATARLIAAVSHPHVHILGHPTGRMIGRRPGLEPDMQALVAAAAAHGTALEINANPRRLDLRDRHVRLALEAGATIAINTDAHAAEHFDFLRYGVLTGRRGRVTAADCINAWPQAKLLAWLGR